MKTRELSETYAEVLEYMSSGVISVTADGRVDTFNPAAAEILGLSREKVVGRLLSEVFLDEENDTNDEFVQAILDAVYHPESPRQGRISYTTPDNRVVTLVVRASQLPGEDGPRGVVIVFSDVSEIEALRRKEAELNRALRDAYAELENTNRSLSHSLKRGQWIRFGATAAILALFGVILWLAWRGSAPRSEFALGVSEESAASGEERMVAVQAMPLSRTLSLKGRLAPLEVVNVVSPFPGKVLRKYVDFGAQVERGDPLVELDSTQLEMKRRTEEAAFIKARRHYEELKDWENGREVARVQRMRTRAANALASAKKKQEEAEYLLKKGIIPAAEAESARERVVNLDMELQQAEDEWKSVLAQGSSNNLHIAEMELENARANVEALDARIASRVVTAPVSGVIMRPVLPREKAGRLIDTGSMADENDILMAVGNLKGLTVRATVDEVDVGRIHVGQPVTVTGEAFEDIALTGTVTAIASEARSGAGDKPLFDVRIAIPAIGASERERIRPGMSATLAVTIYENTNALMAPVEAVFSTPDGYAVRVRDSESGQVRPVPVVTGMTTLDAVEILEGLKEGDEIVIGGAAP